MSYQSFSYRLHHYRGFTPLPVSDQHFVWTLLKLLAHTPLWSLFLHVSILPPCPSPLGPHPPQFCHRHFSRHGTISGLDVYESNCHIFVSTSKSLLFFTDFLFHYCCYFPSRIRSSNSNIWISKVISLYLSGSCMSPFLFYTWRVGLVHH